MFDIEQSIAEWRRQMLAAGVKSPVPLDELESHLRTEFDALVAGGESEQRAFALAVSRMGNPVTVRDEFEKIPVRPITPVIICFLLWFGWAVATSAYNSRELLTLKDWAFLEWVDTVGANSGYYAAFLTGVLGICYICLEWTNALTSRRRQSLRNAVRAFSHLTTWPLFGSCLFGLAYIYANLHRLGFETHVASPFLAIWGYRLLRIQRSARLSERAIMLRCIAGDAIAALALFCVCIMVSWTTGLKSNGSVWVVGAVALIYFGALVAGYALPDEPNASRPVGQN